MGEQEPHVELIRIFQMALSEKEVFKYIYSTIFKLDPIETEAKDTDILGFKLQISISSLKYRCPT